MAYCTEAQIEGEFKDIDFDSTSKVSSDDITRFIAETDALIDSKVGLRYVVPITGATSLLLMRMICIFIIKERVNSIIEVKASEPGKNQETEKVNAGMKMLEDIVEGKMLLSDSTLIASHDGVKGYTYSNDVETVFDVETEMW